MFIYFDRNGVLQEVINDKAARLGDLNANEIYVYVDEVELDDIWLTLKRPDGTLSVEKSFIANKVVREIPYDPKRDMKFFKDFKEYEFYKFTITDEITIEGVYQATIRMTYEDTLSALGVLVFKAETGVIKSDQNITQAQYDYLIWYVGSWQGQIGDLEEAMGIAQADILGLQNRMNVAEQDINKIEDGTTVVSKALKDDLGNTIKSTYANKLDLVYSSSNNRIAITLKSADGNSIDADLIDLPKATTSADGLLSKEDKVKINNIASDIASMGATKQSLSEKNQINGYAGLDVNAKIPSNLLPDSVLGQLEYKGTFTPTAYPLSPEKGWFYISIGNGTIGGVNYNVGDWAVYNGSSWDKVDNTDAVMSVNGKLGVVVLDGTDIKVGNGDTFTIEQRIVSMIADINNRYTKAQTYSQNEIEQRLTDLLGMANLQDILIGSYTNEQTVLASDLSAYNFVIALGKDVENTYTGTFKPSEIVSGDVISLSPTVYLTRGATDFTITTPTSVKLWGIKLDGITADEISYDNTISGLSSTNVKTAIDELSSEKADKLVLTNLVSNGDLLEPKSYNQNEPKGFSIIYMAEGSGVLKDGIFKFTGNAAGARLQTPLVYNENYPKLYIYGRVKADSNKVAINNNTNVNVTYHSGSGAWENLSVVQASYPGFKYASVHDYRTSDWTPIEVDYIGAINLTETFGAGNEPTKEQMDAIIKLKGFFQQTTIDLKDLMLLGFTQEVTFPDITLPTEFVEKYENILNGKFNNLLAYNEYEDENLKKMVKVVLKGNNNTPTGQVKLKLKSLSENLLQFNNMKTATNKGVWAEIEDGVWKLHGTATGGDAYVVVELKEPVTLSDSYSFIVTCNQITVSLALISLQKGTVSKTTLNAVNTNNDVGSRSYSTDNAGEIATSVQVMVRDGINVDGFEIRPQLNNGNFTRNSKAFDNNFGEKEIIIDSLSGEKIIYLEANSRKFSLELEDAHGVVNLSDSCFIVVGAVEKSVKNILTLNEDHKLNLQAIARYNLSSTNHRRWTMLISTDIHGEWDMVERQIEYLNKNNEIMYGMCLGDIVYNNALDSHQGFIDAVKKTRKPYYITLGNHDSGTGVIAATGNTQQQMFDKFIDPLKKYMKLPSITTNYYSQLFDSTTEGNPSTRKVALVVLNSYDIPDTTTTGGDFIVTRGLLNYSQEQIDWLCTTLLEIPANYVLVISSHALKETTEVKKCRFSQLGVTSIFGNMEQEGFNLISDIINAWINGTSLTQSYTQGANIPTISVNVDFSTRGIGLFSCYITGHTHKDLIGNIKKYPNQTIVNLTCSTTGYGQTEPFSDLPRVKGEKSEDALTLISIDNLSGTTSLFRVGSNVTHNAINRDMISFDFDGNIID